MLRLIDLETQQSVDLPVRDAVLQGLREQFMRGRQKPKNAKAFQARIAWQIESAVHNSLDWSVQPPLHGELMHAAVLSMSVGVGIPEKVLRSRRLLTRYLRDQGHPLFQGKRGDEQPARDLHIM